MKRINPFGDCEGNPVVGKEKEYNNWNTQRYVEKLENHVESCNSAINYSIRRFDIEHTQARLLIFS